MSGGGLQSKTNWEAVIAKLPGAKGKTFDDKALALAAKARVFGQDESIDKIAAQLKRCVGRVQMGGGRQQRPLGVFLIAGPPCTGKSLFCKVLAENMYDGKGQLVRLDMDQYAQPQGRAELFGATQGPAGGKGRITSALQENPRTIFQLKGFEKMHPELLKSFATAWKEGYFIDARASDRVSNAESLFFLTSNLAWEELRQVEHAKIADPIRRIDSLNEVLTRSGLPADLVARFDDTFVFDPLNNRSLARMAEAEIRQVVATYGLALAKIEPKYLFDLVTDEETRTGAVRNIARRVDFELADQFLELRQQGVKSISIGQEDGRTVVRDAGAPQSPAS